MKHIDDEYDHRLAIERENDMKTDSNREYALGGMFAFVAGVSSAIPIPYVAYGLIFFLGAIAGACFQRGYDIRQERLKAVRLREHKERTDEWDRLYELHKEAGDK